MQLPGEEEQPFWSEAGSGVEWSGEETNNNPVMIALSHEIWKVVIDRDEGEGGEESE